MDAPIDPRRRVIREEEVVDYNPIPVQPVQPVQQVYQQAVQPVVPVQAVPVTPAVDERRSYSQVGGSSVETTHQGFYDTSGNLVQREEQVFDDPYTRRYNTLDRTARIIYFVLGVLEVLLALRFLFRLISADTANGFANFIFNFTAPFVAPFNGIFNDQALTRTGVVEVSTLLAMAIYALLAYGIVKLLYVLLAPNRSTEEVHSTTRRRRI
jgi:uncharacterized protein YggT (Ycf19 family)